MFGVASSGRPDPGADSHGGTFVVYCSECDETWFKLRFHINRNKQHEFRPNYWYPHPYMMVKKVFIFPLATLFTSWIGSIEHPGGLSVSMVIHNGNGRPSVAARANVVSHWILLEERDNVRAWSCRFARVVNVFFVLLSYSIPHPFFLPNLTWIHN